MSRLTVLALVIAAFGVALLVGQHGYRRGLAEAHAQAEVTRQVTATLTEAAPIFVNLGNEPATDEVPAAWTYAGHRHHGRVTAAEGSRAGTRLRIWVNLSGNHVQPPLDAGDATVRGWLDGSVAFVAAVVVLFLALLVVERRLNRTRIRQWERDWHQFDPQGTERTG